uniref:Putative juvenile hormone-inducible protein n=2 Tax=Nyssomyia neivai TaxID=330878 RepID=A0A1L8DKV9_9DIPT
MASKLIELPMYVKQEVLRIAQTMGLTNPKWGATRGSKNGENYSGDVYRVIAVPEDGTIPEDPAINRSISQKEVHLFVKLAPQSPVRRAMFKTALCFAREKYSYEVVLPRFDEFEKQYLTNDEKFHNYANMVTMSLKDEEEFLIMSDLRREGFWNPNRSTPLNLHQCRLVVATMAKFHAISYAFKDQRPEEFHDITSKLIETMFAEPITEDMQEFLTNKIEYGLGTLTDPNDEENRKRLETFGRDYAKNMISCVHVKEYGAICHGDSWISNLIFRFKNNVEDEVKLLDWQLSRHTTPVLDLSYFVFCCTDEKLRIHLPDLLNEYHELLISRIDKLGSKGMDLYPKSVFEDHCKKYMKYGLGLALMTLHSITCKSSDIPDVSECLETSNFAMLDRITGELVKKPAYIRRMSGVIRDAVRFGYI